MIEPVVHTPHPDVSRTKSKQSPMIEPVVHTPYPDVTRMKSKQAPTVETIVHTSHPDASTSRRSLSSQFLETKNQQRETHSTQHHHHPPKPYGDDAVVQNGPLVIAVYLFQNR